MEISDLADGLNKGVSPSAVVDVNSLMARREGFARSAKGGLDGDVYAVSTLSSGGPASLREALGLKIPLWIVFKVSGEIALEDRLPKVPSHTTIDGRNSRVTLTNHGLMIWDATDVIVENIIITNVNDENPPDALQVVRSSVIWVDHCSFSSAADGLIDITHAPREEDALGRVTISWCRFESHDHVMIIGLHKDKDPNDSKWFVTLHHNYFAGNTIQRHPRVSQGYAHMYNNVVLWELYGAASYDGARLVMDRNYFIAPEAGSKIATTHHHGDTTIRDGLIDSRGDQSFNEAIIEENWSAGDTPDYPFDAWPTTISNMIRVVAGAGYQPSQL
jgi:pectate lyase